jgi:hypothetical protein
MVAFLDDQAHGPLTPGYWTLNGRAWSGKIKFFVNQKLPVLPWDDPARSLNFSRGNPLHLAGGSARPD